MIKTRIRTLKNGRSKHGPVVYWMSRDQRANDNWALIFSQQQAIERKVPIIVIFCVVPTFLTATLRQYDFMLKGLECVEQQLSRANIPFHVLTGKPEKEIVRFLQETGAGMVVTDFDPIKIKRNWKESIQKDISIPFFEVDAHNIIPCWIVSPRREYAAYTIRPKIHRLLREYLDEFPSLQRHPYTQGVPTQPPQWQKIAEGLKIDRTVNAVKWIRPGETDATASLHGFINKKIAYYNARRNDPSTDGQSGLSPYLHFGHIAPQRVALEIRKAPAARESREAFLEELIVRRELADNFCFYNNAYDRYEGFPDWAKTTLDDHRKDEREYIYAPERFETAKTHDDLWNAAQTEMVKRGKMHGYMRMYWAKKILEWTHSPEEAVQTAIYLNDRYELDGRDPNGYAGIAWSIGGVHDRAWNERPVFGKVRYMSRNGVKTKFDVQKYIEYTRTLGE